MTVEKRTLVPLRDVLALEYACPKCNARHSIPFEQMSRVVYRCPNCNEELVSTRSGMQAEMDDAILMQFIKCLKTLQQRELGATLRLEIVGLTEKP